MSVFADLCLSTLFFKTGFTSQKTEIAITGVVMLHFEKLIGYMPYRGRLTFWDVWPSINRFVVQSRMRRLMALSCTLNMSYLA